MSYSVARTRARDLANPFHSSNAIDSCPFGGGNPQIWYRQHWGLKFAQFVYSVQRVTQSHLSDSLGADSLKIEVRQPKGQMTVFWDQTHVAAKDVLDPYPLNSLPSVWRLWQRQWNTILPLLVVFPSRQPVAGLHHYERSRQFESR